MPSDPEATERGEVVVRESVRVDLSPDEAFRLFTEGISEWWPLDEGYSYGGDRAREIFLEAVEGGRFYERFVDGDELQVGTVTVCSPPDHILFTWRSPDWRAETEVDVAFSPNGMAPTLRLCTGDLTGLDRTARRSHEGGGVDGRGWYGLSPPTPVNDSCP